MVKKGSIDVGCGKYSYSLESPPKTPAPTSSVTATCYFQPTVFFLQFSAGITEDGKDFEAALKEEVKGCGAMTGWRRSGFVWEFNLPLTIKASCVERAIKSAGGPQISCRNTWLGK